MISRLFSFGQSKDQIPDIPNAPAEYIELKKSFETLKKNENKNLKFELFQTFLNDFAHFIFNQENDKIAKNTSVMLVQYSMEYLTGIDYDKSLIMLVINILEKVLNITKLNKSDELYHFFIYLSSFEDGIKILQSNKNLFQQLFEDESFFSDFVNNRHAFDFFKEIFINFKSKVLCSLYRFLICEISPIKIRASIDLKPFLSTLTMNINHDAVDEYVIVISKLVSSSSSNRKFFDSQQNFDLLVHFLSNVNIDIILTCLNDLIFSVPTDIDIFPNIILLYQKIPSLQLPMFKWLFNIIETHNEMLKPINDRVQMSNWVTHNTSIQFLIEAIDIVSIIDVELTPQFLPPLFSILGQGGYRLKEYIAIFKIIENLIMLHQISLSFLFDAFFLQAFIINAPISIIGQLFIECETFAQLVYDIYELPKAKHLRHQVLNKLIQMIAQFPKCAHFISVFLVISASQNNIQDLMKIIIDTKNSDLCISLANSFQKSEKFIKYFILSNGIEWIDHIYKLDIINIGQFGFLLNSLTMKFNIKSIDDYILTLPKDHPFFKIPLKYIEAYAFGFENTQSIYPLKLCSLFPLTEKFKKTKSLDPYNAFLIGQNIIDKLYDDPVSQLPFFNDIANRFISDKTFHKLIYLKPEMLERFCDSAYDHFPLFQIFEFSDDQIFNISYTTLSFWFKFSSVIEQEIKILFFHSDKLHLYIKKNILIINYEGVEHEIEINPLTWNHIAVKVKPQRSTHQIFVYVNLQRNVFYSSNIIGDLSSFEFSTYFALLFLGSALRIYNIQKCKMNELEAIFRLGPSFMNPLNESTIITPYSDTLFSSFKSIHQSNFNSYYIQDGTSFLPVKYQSFPSHFLAKKKLTILFDRMKNEPKNEKEFESILSLCFKIYIIMKNALSDFFRLLLQAFAASPQFISLNLFSKTISFFMEFKTKEEIANTIFESKSIWGSISHEIIIYSLVSQVVNFDFYEQSLQAEAFISSCAYFNPSSTLLIETILQNLKESRKFINFFLMSSNFLPNMQNDKFVNNKSEIFDFNSLFGNINNIISEFSNNLSEQNMINTKMKSSLFQLTIANGLKNLIVSTKSFAFIPIEDLIKLYIISPTDLKLILFSMFTEIKVISPESIQFIPAFTLSTSKLCLTESVWNEIYWLITDNGKTISNSSFILPVFSLLWGITVLSIQSIAIVGKEIYISEVVSKVLKFLTTNIKILANNNDIQKFMITMIPFLCGAKIKNVSTKENPEKSQNQIILEKSFDLFGNEENFEITHPQFMSYIRENILDESDFNKTDDSELLKSYEYRNFTNSVLQSEIFHFYASFILGIVDTQIGLKVLVSFLFNLRFSSSKAISIALLSNLIHLILTKIDEEISFNSQVYSVLTIVNYMCISDLFKENLISIISDILVLSSVIKAVHNSEFKKLINNIHEVLCNLFSRINSYDLLSSLFKVLIQHHLVLSEIFSEAGSLEKLLNFLLNQYENLSLNHKEDFEFFMKLINSLNLTEDKIFEIENRIKDKGIPNNLPSQSDISIAKSLDALLKIINDLKGEVKYTFVNEINNLSNVYIDLINNGRKTQIYCLKAINKIISIASQFWNSKLNWQKFLNDYWKNDENNQNQKFVLPCFSFPFNLPRMLVSHKLNSQEELITFISNMSLYNIPFSLTFFHTLNAKDYHECYLKRYSHSIPTVLCFLENENSIVFIPFCSSKYDNEPINEKLYNVEEVHLFIKEVISGMWGTSVSLYNGRIIIKIPLDTIIFIQESNIKEKNISFAIFSTLNGYFILEKFDNESQIPYYLRNNKFIIPLKLNNANRANWMGAFSNDWMHNRIDNFQFIMIANLMNGKNICDKSNWPIFPHHYLDSVFSPENSILEKYFDQEQDIHLDLNNFLISDKQEVINFIQSEFQNNIEEQTFNMKNEILNFDNFVQQKMNIAFYNKIDLFLSNEGHSFITFLPKLSKCIYISRQKSLNYFISIDNNSMTISLLEFSSPTQYRIIHSERSSIFARARNISTSKYGLFFTIDFKYEITQVYRIIFKDNAPFSFRIIRDISFEYYQQSVPCCTDFIGASSSGNCVVAWHFFRNTIHFTKEFPSAEIKFLEIDETNGQIWVIDSHNTLFIISYVIPNQGQTLYEYAISNEKSVTAFSLIRTLCSQRIALIGFSDGSIFSCQLTQNENGFEIKSSDLHSTHKTSISSFILHPLNSFFLSLDSSREVYMWSHSEDLQIVKK